MGRSSSLLIEARGLSLSGDSRLWGLIGSFSCSTIVGHVMGRIPRMSGRQNSTSCLDYGAR